jgi:hypothetical protein
LGSRLTVTAGWEPGLLYSTKVIHKVKETAMTYDDDINLDNLSYLDVDDINETDFESVTFVDFMKMANNAWNDGGMFDVDINIIKDAVWDTPVKVLQRRVIEVDDVQMYEIWASIEVKSASYLVPIRINAHIDEYNKNMFTWKVNSPAQCVNLTGMIDAFEEHEEYKWGDLLG